MSDEIVEPTVDGAEVVEPVNNVPEPANDGFKAIESQDDLNKIVQDRLARKEAQVRKEYEGFDDLKTKAAEYDQYLDSQKSEDQKRQDAWEADKAALVDATSQVEALQAKIADLELVGLRNEIAAAKGVPQALIPRLQGKSAEEIEADCDALLAAVKPQAKRTSDRPKGDRMSGDGDAFDPEKLAAAIYGG